MQLIVEKSGRVAVARLEIADNFLKRFVGLQFRRALPRGAGLLIVPCNSVHTCFMYFAIDVVFLDKQGKVLAIQRSLRPWRLAFGPRGSQSVLEVPAGTADFEIGDLLVLCQI